MRCWLGVGPLRVCGIHPLCEHPFEDGDFGVIDSDGSYADAVQVQFKGFVGGALLLRDCR